MNLEEIRKDIDALDAELVALLEKRMQLVTQVTAYKKTTGKAIFDAAREDIVLEKVASRVENKEFEGTIVNTFADIMKNSRDYQQSKLG